MVPDWMADTLYVSSLLPKRFPEVYSQISSAVGTVKLLHETADIWVRDFMPVQIGNNRFVQFRYHPDYLKGFPKIRTTPDAVRRMLPAGAHCKKCELVIDGGNVVFSSTTAILTDKVFHENPKLGKRQVLDRLEEALECRIVIIHSEPGDVTGHADGVLHFIDDDTVLLNDYSGVGREYGRTVIEELDEHNIKYERVPYYPAGGRLAYDFESAVGNYVNFARVGNVILVGAFGDHADEQGVRRIAKMLPDARIKPIYCRRLAEKGGVVHCASWTVRQSQPS